MSENTQKETQIGTILAILGGIAFAFVFYVILSSLFHVPDNYAVPIAIFIGGVQYFALRFWFLVIGGRKGNKK